MTGCWVAWSGSRQGQVAGSCEYGNEALRVPQNAGNFLTSSGTVNFSRRILLYGVCLLSMSFFQYGHCLLGFMSRILAHETTCHQ